MLDNRIGTPSHQPEVCAVSGKPIAGQYTIRYHLEGGFFVRVLPKYQDQFTDQLRADLKSSVSTNTPKKGSKKS